MVRDRRQRLMREGASLDKLARCSYLAPSITQAVLDGTQPTSLILADLRKRVA